MTIPLNTASYLKKRHFSLVKQKQRQPMAVFEGDTPQTSMRFEKWKHCLKRWIQKTTGDTQ